MKTDSSVAGVELIGPANEKFNPAIEKLWGRPADELLASALPFSVVASNRADRTVAFLGVRFDMQGGTGKQYSVVHYADALRYPEDAELVPGGLRFVCAEPLYTRLVLRRETKIDPRGPMNLANLRRALSIRASIDCIAFDDGHFQGRDSLHAFDRLEQENAAEQRFLQGLLVAPNTEPLLLAMMENPRLRPLARKLHEGFVAGGDEEVRSRARSHRSRLSLHR